MALNITQKQYDDIKALVKSGDVDLAETRAKFQAAKGRETTLDTNGLIAAHAAQIDDDDDELFEKIIEAEIHGTAYVAETGDEMT